LNQFPIVTRSAPGVCQHEIIARTSALDIGFRDPGPKPEGVGARAAFLDQVAAIAQIHEIRIRAAPSVQGVVAGPAEQCVGPAVAEELVAALKARNRLVDRAAENRIGAGCTALALCCLVVRIERSPGTAIGKFESGNLILASQVPVCDGQRVRTVRIADHEVGSALPER
jgi:hypothetical protein